VEPDEERLADIARDTGATEAEARVIYHIRAMNQAFIQVASDEEEWSESMMWLVHSKALMNAILARIVQRDHPEGFQKPQEDDEDKT